MKQLSMQPNSDLLEVSVKATHSKWLFCWKCQWSYSFVDDESLSMATSMLVILLEVCSSLVHKSHRDYLDATYSAVIIC